MWASASCEWLSKPYKLTFKKLKAFKKHNLNYPAGYLVFTIWDGYMYYTY